MAKLHKKIISALRHSWKEVSDFLDDIPETGRVMGVIASPVFRKLDHEARQRKLWNVLKKALSSEELENVGPIATLTPEEATVKIS